ncbi:replication-associated protein [Capybara virus 17_cap1_330]|nr:replication-associated protein [Capybara virus 17_cap1_330]
MPPRKCNVRLQSKRYLLTYPQCTLTKEAVLEALKVPLGIETYTIASEFHQDGTPHIHACIILSSSPNTTNMRYFDIDEYHPNVKTLKSKADFERAERYCRKDGNFITNVEKRLSKRTELFKALLGDPQGLTPQFVRQNPEILALNFEGLRKWLTFADPLRSIPTIRHLPKRRHIWAYGKANTYKSYRLNAFLSLFDQPQQIPTNNDYSGVSTDTDILYCDEFRGHISVQELNRLCDGRAKLNTKGGSTIIAYPLVIITSNYSIRETYPNVTENILETLYARFHQYEFPINKYPFPNCEL